MKRLTFPALNKDYKTYSDIRLEIRSKSEGGKVIRKIVIEREKYKITIVFGDGNEDAINDVKRMLIDSFNDRIQKERKPIKTSTELASKPSF